MKYQAYLRCICGAITVKTDAGDYSCLSRNKHKFFPGLDLRKIPRLMDTYQCDHCINHYGLDLCGCGSGNLFEHCNNGLDACKKPMQVLGEYTSVTADDAWE